MQDSFCRLRRLRQHDVMRDIMRETELNARTMIYPVFVVEGEQEKEPISGMPGMFRQSVDHVVKEAKELVSLGVRAVWLKGFPERRDERASGAYSRTGVVQSAVRAIKDKYPDLVLITDVCLCAYTVSGHCGITRSRAVPPIETGQAGENGSGDAAAVAVLNDATLEFLAKTAVSHAEAGADIVAPSSMMDGQVQAVRKALNANGYKDMPILSTGVRFDSGFISTPEDTISELSKPQRMTYNISAGNVREAMREIDQDVAEGADLIAIEPALFYLDVLQLARRRTEVPLVGITVGAELAMIKAAVASGWSDERQLVLEMLSGVRRAGAELIISAYSKEVVRWLSGQYLL